MWVYVDKYQGFIVYADADANANANANAHSKQQWANPNAAQMQTKYVPHSKIAPGTWDSSVSSHHST
jgi:hypothetical protein